MSDKVEKVIYKSTGGVSLTTVLVIVLLVLKVGKVGAFATLSWWWVFAPWWIPAALGIGFLLILLLLGVVAAVLDSGRKW